MIILARQVNLLNYIKNKGESISREEAKPDFDLKHIYQKSYRLDKFLQHKKDN